jgi:hypothetical protein
MSPFIPTFVGWQGEPVYGDLTSWSSTEWDPPQTVRNPACAVCAEPLRLKHRNASGHDHAAQVDLFPQPHPRPGVHICPAPERHEDTVLLVRGFAGFFFAAYILGTFAVVGFVLGWAVR